LRVGILNLIRKRHVTGIPEWVGSGCSETYALMIAI